MLKFNSGSREMEEMAIKWVGSADVGHPTLML